MKNSAHYARKIRKLIGPVSKNASPPEMDLVRLMVLGVLEEDATPKLAADALARLEVEYVDYNELRVSPTKDIVDCLGRDFPQARVKAEAVILSLNTTFERTNALSLQPLTKKPKREVRKMLREDFGLSAYAEGMLTLLGFGGHAIPVDHSLLVGLRQGEFIHPDADLDDLQGFLERVIGGKEAVSAHMALREHVSRNFARIGKELARLYQEGKLPLPVAPVARPPAPSGDPGLPPLPPLPGSDEPGEKPEDEPDEKPADRPGTQKAKKPARPAAKKAPKGARK